MGLEGRNWLVTAGATRAPIDAVRYIANKSTGRLGALIAEKAAREGAHVRFIHGKGSATPPRGTPRVARVEIETVDDLLSALREALVFARYDAILHAMAVLDYVPEAGLREKVASGREEWIIRLVPTPKVISHIREMAPDSFLVGFKLEVGKTPDELRDAAYQALRRTGADLFLANDLLQVEAGEHEAVVINPRGEVEMRATGKERIAEELVRLVSRKLAEKEPRPV